MKLLFGIFPLLIATIEIQGATKIEIYEIRDSDNGLQLKNMNSNTKTPQKADPILKLLSAPKPKPEKTENKVAKFANQLFSKLNSLRGEKKSNKYHDDAFIYILNNDDFDENSSPEENRFMDKTRNDRATNNVDKNEIRDLLMQLVQTERKPPRQKQRTLRQNKVKIMKKPVLRGTDRDDRVFLPDAQKDRHAYEYVVDDDR